MIYAYCFHSLVIFLPLRLSLSLHLFFFHPIYAFYFLLLSSPGFSFSRLLQLLFTALRYHCHKNIYCIVLLLFLFYFYFIAALIFSLSVFFIISFFLYLSYLIFRLRGLSFPPYCPIYCLFLYSFFLSIYFNHFSLPFTYPK